MTNIIIIVLGGLFLLYVCSLIAGPLMFVLTPLIWVLSLVGGFVVGLAQGVLPTLANSALFGLRKVKSKADEVQSQVENPGRKQTRF